MDALELILVFIAGLLLSYIIDLIMRNRGFGIIGNMILINIPFLAGFYYSDWLIPIATNFSQKLIFGFAVAFYTIFFLSFVKSLMNKI